MLAFVFMFITPLLGNAPHGPTAATEIKFQEKTLKCGDQVELYENKHGANVVVKAEFRIQCTCGPSSEAKFALWGDDYTENYPCKSGNDDGQYKTCGFDVPSGVKLSLACVNDDTPEDQRVANGGCKYVGRIETVVKTAPPPPEPEPETAPETE